MKRWRTSARFLIGVLIFALAGPPIGGVVAWIGMGAVAMRSPLPFIAGSWDEGGALALATGLITAVAAARGLTAWFVPVGAATLVTAIIALVSSDADWPAMLRVAQIFLPPALAAAFICWLVTRPLFRR